MPESPYDIELSNSYLYGDEGVKHIVGILSALDEDLNEQFEFSLIESSSYTDNAYFEIEETSLKIK